MFVIVLDYIHDAINAKLDAAIATCPGAARDREVLYSQLVGYFNEHGVIPDFSIKPPDIAKQVEQFGADSLLPDWKKS
jgi:hypothetical protein